MAFSLRQPGAMQQHRVQRFHRAYRCNQSVSDELIQ
jgi:hypothetical protein